MAHAGAGANRDALGRAFPVKCCGSQFERERQIMTIRPDLAESAARLNALAGRLLRCRFSDFRKAQNDFYRR